MKSIIPQDPLRPLDESVFVWTDEVADIKVENLLKLINSNHVLSKDMFKGGATKSDVAKMREQSKVVGKKKETRAKETHSVEVDEDKITSIVLAILKPELTRIDGTVSAGLASVKELASQSLQYKDSVLATVSGMINQMKTDIVASLAAGTAHIGSQTQQVPLYTANVSMPGTSKQPPRREVDENEKSIRNVLENISHYSTPPDSPNRVHVSVNSSLFTTGK